MYLNLVLLSLEDGQTSQKLLFTLGMGQVAVKLDDGKAKSRVGGLIYFWRKLQC